MILSSALRSHRVAALAWSVGLLALLSVPGTYLPETSVLSSDKLVHLGLFGALGALWMRAYPARRAAVVCWGIVFAVGTEVWQQALPINRSGDPFDVFADALGLALAFGALAWRDRLREKRRPDETGAPLGRAATIVPEGS